MPRRERTPSGLPSREQVIEFLQSSEKPAGKRELAKAFGLKGEEKIALKRLLKDMAEEGLIDGQRTAFHRMGGVPRVTVLRVVIGLLQSSTSTGRAVDRLADFLRRALRHNP